MTLAELKDELRDLGFEEDSTMEEYSEIVIHAINRATWRVFDEVVIPLKGWYKRELSTEETEWSATRPSVLTTETAESTSIGLPDNTLRMTALLAAHYIWLDDDEVKAIYYYNEFSEMASALISACRTDASAKIITLGVGW